MSAQVLPLQPVKLAAAVQVNSPEQTYWRTFKNPLLVPSPANYPITSIVQPPSPPSNAAIQTPVDVFAVTTGARVQIYSTKTRKLLKTITRFDDVAHSGDIRYDGRVLVAGDETGTIQVFDINSRAILKTWKEHKQPVWATKFSPVETTALASFSDDSTVRLWDLPSQYSAVKFVGHTDYVRCGNFMPGRSSSLLVSGSYDQTVRLWDARAPQRAVLTFKHTAPVEAVLPMPSGNQILASAEHNIAVLDVVAGKPLHLINNHQKTVTALTLASNGSRLVSGGLDGHVKVFETTGWNVVYGHKYPSPILSLAVISHGAAKEDKHLVVGMQSGALSIKTRLSGQQKVRERERKREMEALLSGTLDEHDKKQKRKKTSGEKKRDRGRDFVGEGADIIIEGDDRAKTKKLKKYEQELSKAHYSDALDKALATNDRTAILTLLAALRHRSALRSALSNRDEASIKPVLSWVIKAIKEPALVPIAVEVGMNILDLYAGNVGLSAKFDKSLKMLGTAVDVEIEKSKQACSTMGMLGILIAG